MIPPSGDFGTGMALSILNADIDRGTDRNRLDQDCCPRSAPQNQFVQCCDSQSLDKINIYMMPTMRFTAIVQSLWFPSMISQKLYRLIAHSGIVHNPIHTPNTTIISQQCPDLRYDEADILTVYDR